MTNKEKFIPPKPLPLKIIKDDNSVINTTTELLVFLICLLGCIYLIYIIIKAVMLALALQ